MLHMYRLIKHCLVFLFILLPLMLIGVPLLALVLLFIPSNQYKLPALFRWWDNADGYVGRDTSVYESVCNSGYGPRFNWLALRNPINYFDYVYMGYLWNGKEVYTVYNPADDNVGDGTRAGFRYIEVTEDNGGKKYEYYWIYQYPFAKKVCFRYRMGWKIGDNKNPAGSISQWCLVVSPWHNYTGI